MLMRAAQQRGDFAKASEIAQQAFAGKVIDHEPTHR
jgi:hypothetical protein